MLQRLGFCCASPKCLDYLNMPVNKSKPLEAAPGYSLIPYTIKSVFIVWHILPCLAGNVVVSVMFF